MRPTTKLIEAYERGTLDSISGEYRGEGVTNIYNIYGNQSRVNVGSADSSTNISTVTSEQLFSQIRETISKSGSTDSEKNQLLAKLQDMESAKGYHSFTEKYQTFITAAANHMTLLAPFIPALTQMLSGK
jgi:hypothetical protein